MESTESLSCLVCVFAYLINFSKGQSYVIPEEQGQSTFVGNIAFDADIRSMVSEEQYRNLEYFSLENTYQTHFTINSSTSDLRIKEPLDREVLCQYETSVSCFLKFEVAVKSKIDSWFHTVEVNIELEDINDNPPSFGSPKLLLTVSESEVKGKSIEIDGATDLDSSNYSIKGYELYPSTVPFLVELNEDTSAVNLIVNGELDRENVDAYTFQLLAYDGGNPPLSGSITVEVSVGDANDNKPAFEQSVYEITVKETFPLNTTLETVYATDKDIGENARISYKMSSQQTPDILDTFEINDVTGELYLISNLVYKSEEPVNVKVEAIDHGTRPLTATATVKVTIEDSINVRPEITLNLLSQSETAVATEYASIGTVVAYVKVKDNDGGSNGMINCLVENTLYFGIQGVESKEYKVIVIRGLDRESIDRHNVTIVCHDYGNPRLNASANFTVVITDENDSEPIFTRGIYKASLFENKNEGHTIVQVHADDADIGKNGNVTYSLDPVYEVNFTINQITGLIMARKSFDREERESYEIVVMAVDNGNTPLSSTARVAVTIRDENDNEPVFKKDRYDYFIPESELRETVLGKVSADDADEGGNGYVSYSLVGNYSQLPFEVLPDGTVKTKKELDREETPGYNFQIMAIDSGVDIRRSSVVNVSVHVTDVNDNAPMIIFPQDDKFVKFITYMTPVDTQVMKIEATDADYDKNGDLTYRVIGRNDTAMFKIGRNGEVYVARRLIETDINRYYLDVIVSDQGDEPKSVSTRLNIEVLAKNITAVAPATSNIDQQNVIIAVVVVVVTSVIAAAILVIIWVVRRHDLQKQKYLEGNNNNPNCDNEPGLSSNGGIKTPNTMKMFENGLLPTKLPATLHAVPSSPPLNTYDRIDGKQKDVKFQDTVHVREKSSDSMEDSTTVERHRLASIRLHQAFVQNQDKQWTSQSELGPEGSSKDMKKQEDMHSDMSAETATYDSGIGGSVSDTADVRFSQLQQLVRQSGRRGKPLYSANSQPPKIIARGRSNASDIPPERPPPLKNNPYKMAKSPIQNGGTRSPIDASQRFSPSPTSHCTSHFSTSSPTPVSTNQINFFPSSSPTKMIIDAHQAKNPSPSRHSPSKNVVQDLLMYKKFQNGLQSSNRRLPVDESCDTTQFDEDDSTTSGSYYIDSPPIEDWQHHHHPPVSDIYV